MALVTCTECGKDVSDKATHCIHCGVPYNLLPQKKTSGCVVALLILIIVPVVAFILLTAYGAASSRDSKTTEFLRDQKAVSDCYRMAENMEINQDSALVADQACRYMENEFRKKWGRGL